MKRKIALIIVCTFIIVSTTIVTLWGVTQGASDGQLGSNMYGLRYFMAYTIDSNIVNAVCLCFVLVCTIKACADPHYVCPRWVVSLQLMGTAIVTVTFLTVICFLAPMQIAFGKNALAMFMDDMFFFHLLNPILSMIGFIALQPHHRMELKDYAIAVIPTFVYAVIYYLCVIVWKVWKDIYGFSFGGNTLLALCSFAVMLLVAFLIALVLGKLHNRVNKLNKTPQPIEPQVNL